MNLPAYEDGIECSETSAYKIQTPGNYPKENIQPCIHVCIYKFRVTLESSTYTSYNLMFFMAWQWEEWVMFVSYLWQVLQKQQDALASDDKIFHATSYI